MRERERGRIGETEEGKSSVRDNLESEPIFLISSYTTPRLCMNAAAVAVAAAVTAAL